MEAEQSRRIAPCAKTGPRSFYDKGSNAKTEPPRMNNGRLLRTVLLTTGTILLLFVLDSISSNRLTLRTGMQLRGFAPFALLYNVRNQKAGRSSFELFVNQDPAFTQVLSPVALGKVLMDRKRLRGGTVKNTLVVACSGISNETSTMLALWNSVHGIRELVFVDYSNTYETSQESLRLVSSTDKLGRIIYVTVTSQNASRPAPGRLFRAQALNLGVAMSSGENIALVDCSTVVSPNVLSEHPLSNRTFYTGTPSNGIPGEYDVIYIKKQAFEEVHGFDERIEISGVEYLDLVKRLRALRLRRLSMDTKMIIRKTLPETILIDQPLSFETSIDAIEQSTKLPKLLRLIWTLAIEEVPIWNGSHRFVEEKTFGLRGFRFRALREQVENTRIHPLRRTDFQFVGESDNRLWIHATQKDLTSHSLLSDISPALFNKVVLEAHRRLLHEDYKVPWQVLRFMEMLPKSNPESKMHRIQQQLANYSPMLSMLFELVWRQKQLLVFNLEVDDVMDLFIGTSWAIASALSTDRALFLTGHFRHTPISELIDYEGTKDTIHREYNVKINIIGGNGNWDCKRSGDGKCWADEKLAAKWDEYNLTKEPSTLKPNASQHVLMNVVSKHIIRWDHDTQATMSFQKLQEKAFASISLSSEVGKRMWNTSQAIKDNPGDATALWLTKPRKEARRFVQVYMEHHALREGNRPLLFAIGSTAQSIQAAHKVVPYEDNSSGPYDAFRRLADTWIALQCRNIVFDSDRLPSAWMGADGAILEWRRIHAPESPHYGLLHVLLPNGTSTPSFHKLEFYVEPNVDDEHGWK